MAAEPNLVEAASNPARVTSDSAGAALSSSEIGLQPFPPGFEGLDFEQIRRKGPAFARLVALLAWADRVSKEELPQAVRTIAGSLRDDWSLEAPLALSMLMARWGEKDPAFAVDALHESPHALRLSPLLGWPALMAAIGRADPELARRTFDENALVFRQPGMAGLWSDFGIALGAGGIEDSLEWAATLPGSQRTSALVSLMHSGRFSSPESAESIRAYMELPQVRSALLDRWSTDDPAGAVTWLGPYYEGREEALLHRWIGDDPGAAAEWAGRNLDADAQTTVWPGIAASYVRRDPTAATEWVTTLPEGSGRNDAIKAIAAEWGDEAALVWARDLTDPSERRLAEQAYEERQKNGKVTP